MEKEFIPYELSLRVKELGFDEPCFTYFLNGIIQPSLNPKDYTYFSEMSKINKNMLNHEIVLAPTYSQAFRWFREKYKLQHHIWSGKINSIFYGYNILNIEEQEFVVNNSVIGGGDCDYYTYEEAELECLKKLIEIVEQKIKD